MSMRLKMRILNFTFNLSQAGGEKSLTVVINKLWDERSLPTFLQMTCSPNLSPGLPWVNGPDDYRDVHRKLFLHFWVSHYPFLVTNWWEGCMLSFQFTLLRILRVKEEFTFSKGKRNTVRTKLLIVTTVFTSKFDPQQIACIYTLPYMKAPAADGSNMCYTQQIWNS